jgi:peptidoglycan/xylan/chitin deacetylase (PgdA/CDA1 family)
MAQQGITVGSHGKTHRAFPTLTTAELWQEVSGSKALLENWLEQSVTWLSYPFGEVDERILPLLPRAGYQGAVTTRYGLSNGEGPFVLRRIAVGGQTTFAQFMTATSGVRELASVFDSRQEEGPTT